jgi:hypothetical protein
MPVISTAHTDHLMNKDVKLNSQIGGKKKTVYNYQQLSRSI